jgi:hypothetical protein
MDLEALFRVDVDLLSDRVGVGKELASEAFANDDTRWVGNIVAPLEVAAGQQAHLDHVEKARADPLLDCLNRRDG